MNAIVICKLSQVRTPFENWLKRQTLFRLRPAGPVDLLNIFFRLAFDQLNFVCRKQYGTDKEAKRLEVCFLSSCQQRGVPSYCVDLLFIVRFGKHERCVLFNDRPIP